MAKLRDLLFSRDYGSRETSIGGWYGGAKVRSSKTAIRCDSWDMRKGREAHEALSDEHKAVIKELSLDGISVGADAFASLYQYSPQINDYCDDERRKQWMEAFLGQQSTGEMRANTVLNSELATIGAQFVAAEYSKWIAEQKKRDEKEAQENPNPSNTEKEMSDMLAQISAERSAGKAAKQGAEKTQEAADGMHGIGMMGRDAIVSSDDIALFFSRTKRNPRLRSIVSLAGRMKRHAAGLRRGRVKHGVDDVLGVQTGDSIPLALPEELAVLAHPTLRAAALVKISQRAVLQTEIRGTDRMAKGPIVIVVDESSSMDGFCGDNSKIVTAKAIAATMVWVASQQSRWVVLVPFSGDIPHIAELRKSCYVSRPGRTRMAELMDWLEHYYRGGTEFLVPFNTVPFTLWPRLIEEGMPRGKTDLIVITDMECELSNAHVQKFQEWRETEKVQSYGIIVERSIDDESLAAKLFDRYWIGSQLDVGSAASDAIFSI